MAKARVAPQATVLYARLTGAFTDTAFTPTALADAFDAWTRGAVFAVKQTGGALVVQGDGTLIAHWGLAAGTGDAAHDALNAARAVLLMRVKLLAYNHAHAATLPSRLTMEAGISTGRVVGLRRLGLCRRSLIVVGSALAEAEEAARQAGDNQCDIMLTAKTWRLIRAYVLAVQQPRRLYALVNLRARARAPQPAPLTLQDLRALLAVPNANNSQL
jgi:hypothetical protein